MQIDQNIFYDEFKNKLSDFEHSLDDVCENEVNEDHINGIFRSIHTIKSTADLLGMFDIVTITHKAEDILDEVRNNKLSFDSKLCNLFFELKDFISLSVDNISNGIYDDISAQNLANYFKKELEDYHLRANDETRSELEDINILVVEGSSLNRYMIKKVAIDKGFNVLITDNGIDGFNKIKRNDFDLIFCDISSSNIDTKNMLKLIKNDILYDHIPVVLLVEKIDMELQKYGKEIGAKAWLTKPIQQDQLKIILDKVFS